MFRNLLCAGFFLAVTVGLVAAEEFGAIIRKVEDGKVTFTKFAKKGEKGPEATLPTAENVKVLNATFNRETKKSEPGAALEGGLQNERLKNIGEKGRFARIITDSDGKKITEIHVIQFKKN